MNGDPEPLKTRLLAMVQRFALDLEGLTVLTEAASGAYADCAPLCALAGARVLIAAQDSRFGSRETLIAETLKRAERCEVSLEVVEREQVALNQADLITNSAGLRPLDARLIGWMKQTAVIPLMYEPWEHRTADVDLAACKEQGILLLGTDEGAPILDFKRWFGPLGRALLDRLGVQAGRVVVLGAGLGGWIAERLPNEGAFTVDWFANETGARPYSGLAEHMKLHQHQITAVLCAEHCDPIELVGNNGLLSADRLRGIPVGHISGTVQSAGLDIQPEPRPFGYMSFQPFHISDTPVHELFAAGLAVGQVMARARRAGSTVAQAAQVAINGGLAADFPDPHSWIRPNGR